MSESDAAKRHALLLGPSSPRRRAGTGKQAPHVLACVLQGARLRVAQSMGTDEQSTPAVSAAAAYTDSNGRLLKSLVLLADRARSRELTVAALLLPTVTGLATVELASKESYTCTIQAIVPTGRNVTAKAATLRDCTSKNIFPPGVELVTDSNPNSYVIGTSWSVQPIAAIENWVSSPAPLGGETVSVPGIGGPLTVTVIDAEVEIFAFTSVANKVNVKLDLGGSESGGKMRFSATACLMPTAKDALTGTTAASRTPRKLALVAH